jgi:hypothetical protein
MKHTPQQEKLGLLYFSSFYTGTDRTISRRLIGSSRPTEIFQPPQQGFFSVHAQLQLLGKIVRLLGNCIVTIVTMIRYMYKLIGGYGWLHRNKKD